jgi:hypothetical protein
LPLRKSRGRSPADRFVGHVDIDNPDKSAAPPHREGDDERGVDGRAQINRLGNLLSASPAQHITSASLAGEARR